MAKPSSPAGQRPPTPPSIFSILKPYRFIIGVLIVLALASNGLTLWLPKIISHAIDSYAQRQLKLGDVAETFSLVSIGIFIFTYLQSIVQTFASEQVARDMRDALAAKISRQNYAYIQEVGPSKLLTNLTSDIDSVKVFVAQAIASLVSSVFLIVGASALLLITDWRLALAVLTIVPIIAVTFYLTLAKVRQLFFKSREVIDHLNRVINESILGAALVRVLKTDQEERAKFQEANSNARGIGLQIVRIFSALIPVISVIANAASIIILTLGGHYIINGTLSLGNFAAFNTYIAILIFPILVIGFMSNLIAQASASYARVAQVIESPEKEKTGTRQDQLKGNVKAKNITITYGEKQSLQDVSFSVKAGSRTAIIGPTAAGKTQLLYALTGLIELNGGEVLYDGHLLQEYEQEAFHQQVGMVFQDSIVFNMSLRENIAFSGGITEENIQKAIETAELSDFVDALPEKLETIVSERGTSLSGGQKQRLMLARALALNPRILLLDDFTARVDTVTERKILDNVRKNYPGITLISVTQKIASVEHYDQIILLMEGEVLASGTHKELLKESPEYIQIYTTQRSTNSYEVHAE